MSRFEDACKSDQVRLTGGIGDLDGLLGLSPRLAHAAGFEQKPVKVGPGKNFALCIAACGEALGGGAEQLPSMIRI
ncbi:MAG TPA: hypothetical protein VKK31_31765 [Thermoanaerobaculia bacterium]|nr:hypothetical protein [Thermoanaerobaculia bacterium]